MQLSGAERDAADRELMGAKTDAKMISRAHPSRQDQIFGFVGVAELIKLKSLLHSENELTEVVTEVRRIIPDVKVRVQRSYMPG